MTMLIQKYDSRWIQDFDDLKSIIQDALFDLNVSIEHIGSTAVPGLAAKPIIDIDIVFENDSAFEEIKSRLSRLGYYHNGDQGIAGREAFKRHENQNLNSLDQIRHHLYVCQAGNEELRRHILFRDYLRSDEEARKEYQELKYQMAKEANQDYKSYTALKEEKARDFIEDVISKVESMQIRS